MADYCSVHRTAFAISAIVLKGMKSHLFSGVLLDLFLQFLTLLSSPKKCPPRWLHSKAEKKGHHLNSSSARASILPSQEMKYGDVGKVPRKGTFMQVSGAEDYIFFPAPFYILVYRQTDES